MKHVIMIASAISLGLSACAQETKLTDTNTPQVTVIRAEAKALLASDEITTRETNSLRSEGNITLIDVRRPNEWAESGMAEGAIGATLQDDDFVDQILTAVGGDKTKPVALICRSGGRSAKAQKILAKEGYTTVINVEGGTLDWIKQDLPLQSYDAG